MRRSPAHPRRVLLLGAAVTAVLAGVLLAVAPGLADDHPPPLAIGSPAPDFSLPGVDGRTYSLASFRTPGCWS